jgi:hypothetical protein
VIHRTSVLPRWLAWLGIVAAIALVFDVVYINIFPFWTWVGIASIVMLVRDARQHSADAKAGAVPISDPAQVG